MRMTITRLKLESGEFYQKQSNIGDFRLLVFALIFVLGVGINNNGI
jgi:hypothetical protein